MKIFLMLALFFIPLVFFTLITLGIWVYRDAIAHGESGVLWVLVALLVPNLLGLLLYFLVVRRNPKVPCPHCGRYTSSGKKYCEYCGEEVPYVEPEKGHNKFAVMALVGFVLMILFVLCFFVAMIARGPAMERTYYESPKGLMEKMEDSTVFGSDFVKTVMVDTQKNEANVEFINMGIAPVEITDLYGKEGFKVKGTWESGTLTLLVTGEDGREKTFPLKKGENVFTKEDLPSGLSWHVELKGVDAKNGQLKMTW